MKLDPELVEYFKEAGFAVILAKVDLGEGGETVVLVKSTSELIMGLKNVGAKPSAGFLTEKTEAGPVVCLAMACEAPGVGELLGETYLDIFDEMDTALLESLAVQKRLKMAMYDEELSLAYLAELTWGDIERLSAEQSLDRAEELAEKTAEADFDRALDIFQSSVSVETISMIAKGGVNAD